MLIGVVLLVGALRILQVYWPIEWARPSARAANEIRRKANRSLWVLREFS
jgi:hypothetical protein